jgi:hypothetical protein
MKKNQITMNLNNCYCDYLQDKIDELELLNPIERENMLIFIADTCNPPVSRFEVLSMLHCDRIWQAMLKIENPYSDIVAVLRGVIERALIADITSHFGL